MSILIHLSVNKNSIYDASHIQYESFQKVCISELIALVCGALNTEM